ncbi:hypothetical protein Lesp02_61100 [Lentzea sp. NBRC 105346]|nr:hypothetical protein Lesp02_61100 [Lentzea sp. NBRC 105346]
MVNSDEATTVVAVLAAEDLAEELGLDPHARITCAVHRCWLHQCVSAPDHVIAVTGHRWCRACARPLEVSVDETTTRSVHLYCPSCGGGADTIANRQLVRACRTSIAAMHGIDELPLCAP